MRGIKSQEYQWFDPTSFPKFVDTATFNRGQTLNKKRNALMEELVPDEDNASAWEIGGTVLGSHGDPYFTTVNLEMGKFGELTRWRSDCSCPMMISCKHGVALTLAALQDACEIFDMPDHRVALAQDGEPSNTQRAVTERKVSRRHLQQLQEQQSIAEMTWLDRAMPVHPGASIQQARYAHTSVSEKGIAFVLRAEPLVQRGLQPTFQQFNLRLCTFEYTLKKRTGEPGVLRPLEYTVIRDHFAPHLVSDNAFALVDLLRSQTASSYPAPGQPVLIKGEMGGLLLKMASETGRLYWEGEHRALGAPFKLGAPRPLHWQWDLCEPNELAEPLWCLKISVSSADNEELPSTSSFIYANTPPLYVDHSTGEVGVVNHQPLSVSQLLHAMKMPPVRQQWLQDQAVRLASALPNVPMPKGVEALQQWLDIEPRGILEISPIPEKQVKSLGPFSARLQFAYQTHELSWPSAAPTESIHTEQGRLLIHRHRYQESQISQSLNTLGLDMDAAGDWWPQAENVALFWADQFDKNFSPFEQAGLQVRVAVEAQTWLVQAGPTWASLDTVDSLSSAENGWFDLSLGIEIDGQRHNLLPWMPKLLDQAIEDQPGQVQWPEHVYVPLPDQRMLRLAVAPLRPWLNALIELVGDKSETFNVDSLRLSQWDALRVGASLDENVPWTGADTIRQMLTQLGNANGIQAVALPQGLQANLRPYQHDGVNWLQFLARHRLGGLLADDMGLGKTLQTLTHLLLEKEACHLTTPALIVAPVSLLGNWQKEAARFCPALRVHVVHGADRHHNIPPLSELDVVITAYSLLQRDEDRWLAQPWHSLVLDEAQNIKNANTYAAKVVGQIAAHHKICLSGTPLENHLGELWSLFHFLMPGFLGPSARFTKLFRTPIEKHNNTERLDQLRKRVTPFMLRRTKALVASELPPKQETTLPVAIEGPQANLYETIRLSTEATVREALAKKGLQRSQITILDALLKLRQVCCHPQLLPLTSGKRVKTSAKLDQLMDMLPELIAEGRKILLFSQFTSMLELIEARLATLKGLKWVKLTGRSTQREAIISQFTEGHVPLFLISLKAGGVGLNLPQADTVIHYDPWWNPAVENQATDRAHRIGQTKNVWVIKLVAQGTIEERILALQERKAELANSLYSGAQERKQPLFDESDLQLLLKPLGQDA